MERRTRLPFTQGYMWALSVMLACSAGLQAQTGTDVTKPAGSEALVKKRGLFFVPDYLTVRAGAPPVAPMSTAQKYKVVWSSSVDYGQPILWAGVAGISQAANFAPSRQGAEAYGVRVGYAAAGTTTDDLLTIAVLPSLLHIDPRYFQKGKGSNWSRARYAVSRTFVARKDDGSATFNYVELGGTAVNVAISNSYYPDNTRNATASLERYGIILGARAAIRLAREFWVK